MDVFQRVAIRVLAKHGDHDQLTHGNWAQGGSSWQVGQHGYDPPEPRESVSSMEPDERETLEEHLVDYKADRSLDPEHGGVFIADLIPGAETTTYLNVPAMDQVHEFMGLHPNLDTDPEFYAETRTRSFEKLPIQPVPVSQLVFTQETVNEAKAIERPPIPVHEWFTWPQAVEFAGRYYLLNGHHRVVPNIVQAGVSVIPMHVLRVEP